MTHSEINELIQAKYLIKEGKLNEAYQLFYIAYIFKGDSYYALKKVNSFIEQVQKEGDIWQKMLKYFQKNQEIHSKHIPLLDSLIIDTFINKRYFPIKS